GVDQRGQQRFLADDGDVEGLGSGAGAGLSDDGHADGEHVALAVEPAGDAGADVGIDDAEAAEGRAHLEADRLAGVNGVDVAAHEGELTGAQPEEGVAPAVDAVAVDVGDGADAGEVEVAADQGDGEGTAGFQGGVLVL